MYLTIAAILFLSVLHVTQGYPTFQQNIPNGEIVPSPCNPNHVWQGVGHQAKGGGGPRNPFGLDFKANGYTWTTALCQMDSDGDGKTNGEELGDPDCSWSKGNAPKTSVGLSHPGICEPIDSELCKGKNDFLNCETAEFVCPSLSDPDVVNVEIRLTETAVPAVETTYICQVLDVPADKDYHLVAYQPYIDNVNVMHHIIAYGCKDDANISAEKYEPQRCFMNRQEGCEDMIALWAVGSNGGCYHPDAGFLIGQSGYKKVLIEMHWNNPMLVDNYRDGSGLILHLTPNLRPYNAGIFMIGQSILVIPPGREAVHVNGTCSRDCTAQKMNDSIYVFAALNHMHYLGSSALTQMVTADDKVVELARDDKYSYDAPMFYTFDKPVVMEPGTQIQTFCTFKSTSRTKTTFSGESTSEEMCYAFLMYYPKENWNGGDCVSTGPGDSCAWESGNVNGCNTHTLWNPLDPSSPAQSARVWDSCLVGHCVEECKPVAREVWSHPCFQFPLDFVWQYSIRENYLSEQQRLQSMEYWYKLSSCNAEMALEKCDGYIDGGDWVTGGATIHITSVALVLGLSVYSLFLSLI